jgi:hypothetical protein
MKNQKNSPNTIYAGNLFYLNALMGYVCLVLICMKICKKMNGKMNFALSISF